MEYRPGRAALDLSQIKVDAFTQTSAIRQRLIGMSMAEIAARTGGMRYQSRSSLRFTRGNKYTQTDTQRDILHTPTGDYQMVYDTGEHRLERYLIGEKIFVREDKGELREQVRRETDEGYWPDQAAHGLHDALMAANAQIQFTESGVERRVGRDLIRFLVAKDVSRDPAAPYAQKHEKRFTARWREQANVLDLEGSIWVDPKLSVIVASDIQLKAEVLDRAIRPTQLTLSFQHNLTDLGLVTTIVAPEARPDYKRHIPDADPLAFFRDHLPKPASPQPQQTP